MTVLNTSLSEHFLWRRLIRLFDCSYKEKIKTALVCVCIF
jgi:hypothetical protein